MGHEGRKVKTMGKKCAVRLKESGLTKKTRGAYMGCCVSRSWFASAPTGRIRLYDRIAHTRSRGLMTYMNILLILFDFVGSCQRQSHAPLVCLFIVLLYYSDCNATLQTASAALVI